MAEALFNNYAAGRARAASAGTRPATHVDRNVVEVMKELGLDIRGNWPKKLTPQMVEEADRVVTMGCGVEDVCPAVFVPAEDWHVEDPEGKPIDTVRKIRDDIASRVKGLVEDIESERRLEAATTISTSNDSRCDCEGGERK